MGIVRKIFSLVIFLSMVVVLSFMTKPVQASEQYLWPVPGTTTDDITGNYIEDGHHAIDIGIDTGNQILATKSGTVFCKFTGCNNVDGANFGCSLGICDLHDPFYYNGKSYCNWGFGNGIVLQHDDGTFSYYAHLISIPDDVVEGHHYPQGTLLGLSGSTGFSYAHHLHFALSTFFTLSDDNPDINPEAISYIYEVPSLESIAVTTKTDPLVYHIGDSFNPSDIIVTGTYGTGDGSYTQEISNSQYNITGFDSSSEATDQVVTVNVDGKSATFPIQIVSESTDYTYRVDKITGEASITDYIGPDPNGTGVAIEIPSVIGVHPVTSIASLGGHGTNFNPSGKKITSVTVPEGVTRIELGAFSYDDCLNHISLPNSLTYIGDMAFQMNFGLNNVIIPDNVTFIGPSAFYACWSLNNITLPKDLTRIEDHVFMGCKSLTNIAIPDNVTYIGYQSFASCSKLTNIFIPDKVTYIGPQAFASSGLTNITIPSNISIIRIMAFQECYSLKSIVFKSENTIIEDENIGGLEPKFYTIPEVTTVIGYEGSTSEKYATNLNHIRAFRTIIPGLPIVVLDARSPNTEVTSDSVQVVVLSEVANGTLITTPENGHVTVPEVRISSDVTNSGEVIVSLSDGTTITGPANWDGTIYLPQVTSSGSSEAIRKYPLLLSEGVSFEIGLADESLNFDQPVRIAIQGQGGQSAGLVRTDGFNFEFIPIKYRMDSDSADALGANNEGYLNVGSDLVIWTTHFTTFVAYTETSLTGFTLSGQVLVEGDDLTEGQTHYSGGVSIELKQGEEIKYSATTSEAKDLASNGSFRITGIEDGEYTVVISKAGYLTRSFNLSINSDLTLTTTSSQYLNRIYLWAGDIVNDEYNVIAASDVNYILSKFNSNSTQAGFDPQADIVKDQYDVISAADINLMLSNFNKNSTQYPADIIY